MTFNQLFSAFRSKYDNSHDVIFFDLIGYCSKTIKTKEDFISKRNNEINFSIKKFWKYCDDYFKKEKPLAHITGRTTFCGLNFIIDKKVLAPREITEQMTFDFIAKHKNVKGKLFDLCCGSGCIGISIKKHLPQLDVTCIDKYWKPILNTHENARRLKTPLTIDCKDVFEYLRHKSSVDYIISNPPYINQANFSNTKMYKWEDKKALIAKENGMYFYKRYFTWLDKHTFKEAWFEIGYDLVDALKHEISKYPSLKMTFGTNNQYIVIKRKL